MAQVDFTLDEFRQVVRDEVEPMIIKTEQRILHLVQELVENSELRITKAVQGSFLEYEKKYDKKFEQIDERFDAMDSRFDAMDSRFDAMDSRFDAMDDRFDAMDARFDLNDAKVDKLTGEVKTTRKLVGLHSEEIMELKARPA